MVMQYRLILDVMAAEDMKSGFRQQPRESGTADRGAQSHLSTIGRFPNDICKDCGHPGHAHKGFHLCPKHVKQNDSSSGAERQRTSDGKPTVNMSESMKHVVEYCRKNESDFPYLDKGEKGKRSSWVCGKQDVTFFSCDCAKCAKARKNHPSIVRDKAVTNSTEAETSKSDKRKSSIKRGSGTACAVVAMSPEIYDNEHGAVEACNLLKLDSCSNRNLSPYITDFVRIRKLRPDEQEDISGVWGAGNSPEYIGDALFWVEDKEGCIRPIVKSDMLYDERSNARIVSNAHLKKNGVLLDLYMKQEATFNVGTEDEFVLAVHMINDLSTLLTVEEPDDIYESEVRLTAIPADIGYTFHGGDKTGVVNTLSPNDSRKALAHHRLMHPGEHLMDKTREFLEDQYGAKELPDVLCWSKKEKMEKCESCPAGKAKSQPIPKSTKTQVHSRIGERMYSDTSGDLPVKSVGKSKNTHTLTDSASRMGWACGLKKKTDITDVIEDFIDATFVGEHSDMEMKELLTDNDNSNYGSGKFKKMMHKHQVSHITITPHILLHRLEGLSERRGYVILWP